MDETTMLSVTNLSVSIDGQPVVSGLDFELKNGERLCLLGASGSGKSTIAAALTGTLAATTRVTGSIDIRGHEVAGVPISRRPPEARAAAIFQDSLSSLNPLVTVRRQLLQPFLRRGVRGRAADTAVESLLARVGIEQPRRLLARYPGELSGGQRQRICIAVALAGTPGLVVADEPTTALDVVTQARVLDLLRELSDDRRMTLLLITHDLAVAAKLCERAIVLAGGRAVESAPMDELIAAPQHPYTRALIDAASVTVSALHLASQVDPTSTSGLPSPGPAREVSP
ncbi:ATP-binding cassette domain-containing protein [Luethyella okanaganae]|uniref:ATP-binding cassette domain-containing protein n=1 Tax=Luethyella okanaganae TaxID=69372 RepID=A0ABW1VFX5_9MICO